ncbi:MAG TPA: DUF5666 domain-containing protein [Candidatus Paceibacterota bacterium]|nr:DUF5666 domain-containing protein [Candidatus Paceibacterota bacterium]
MKNFKLKHVVGGIALLAALAVVPAGAKALSSFNTDTSTGVSLNAQGELKVVGATVNSVSNNTINATAHFANSELDFSVVTDSDTRINGTKENKPSVSALKSGDRISFAGRIMSSDDDSMTVDAEHVVSKVFQNSLAGRNVFTGEVKDVDDNEFTLRVNGKDVEVRTTSTTTITIDGETRTLASLEEGDKVRVEGSINASLDVITATKITATSSDSDDDEDDDEDKDNGKHKGWFWGLGNIFKRDK